jgi:hypothetical protein
VRSGFTVPFQIDERRIHPISQGTVISPHLINFQMQMDRFAEAGAPSSDIDIVEYAPRSMCFLYGPSRAE